jgi:hypothetical protein
MKSSHYGDLLMEEWQLDQLHQFAREAVKGFRSQGFQPIR